MRAGGAPRGPRASGPAQGYNTGAPQDYNTGQFQPGPGYPPTPPAQDYNGQGFGAPQDYNTGQFQPGPGYPPTRQASPHPRLQHRQRFPTRYRPPRTTTGQGFGAPQDYNTGQFQPGPGYPPTQGLTAARAARPPRVPSLVRDTRKPAGTRRARGLGPAAHRAVGATGDSMRYPLPPAARRVWVLAADRWPSTAAGKPSRWPILPGRTPQPGGDPRVGLATMPAPAYRAAQAEDQAQWPSPRPARPG